MCPFSSPVPAVSLWLLSLPFCCLAPLVLGFLLRNLSALPPIPAPPPPTPADSAVCDSFRPHVSQTTENGVLFINCNLEEVRIISCYPEEEAQA